MSGSSVSQIARQFGIRPRVISDLFYGRVLDDSRCPLTANGRRRIIPSDYLPVVKEELERRGHLKGQGQ